MYVVRSVHGRLRPCVNQVAKNKIAPPFRVVEMDILFGTGIDTISCLLDAAEDAGIFTRKGSWYSYDGKNVAQVQNSIIDRVQYVQVLALTCHTRVANVVFHEKIPTGRSHYYSYTKYPIT